MTLTFDFLNLTYKVDPDMVVGPFSITQPNPIHDFTDPTRPTTYVVTRDPTQPNIEQQHDVVQIG